ncbi:MAG: hypothetical protein FJ398_06065 [Verrucomicrobia bacterium]|nr:hypothetical protein [Verrucomicrobiota bacterium]
MRLSTKKDDLKPFGVFAWFDHGPCEIAGVETPVEVCEIREGTEGGDNPPSGLTRASARNAEEETAVWGWRPGPGSAIPGTRFALEERFADGRFGEEWIGGEPNVKEKRLFQFCDGVGRVAGDLRAAIKEREARVGAQAQTSRREMIQKIVMISLSVVAFLAIAIFGPKYLRRRRQKAQEELKRKPGSKTSGKEDAARLTCEESRGGKADSGDQGEAEGGSTTHSRPAGAVREKKKEEAKESAQSFFNLIVLPIALVIILGTVLQQFGPKLKKLIHKPPPPPPPEE